MKTSKLTKYLTIIILIIASITTGVIIGRLTSRTANTEGLIDLNYVNGIFEQLNGNYLGEIPATKELTYGAVKGLIESLDDEYTNYLDPNEAKEYLKSASSDFDGIGITLGKKDQYVIVETVLPGQPAEKAGVLVQDYIIEVDGVSTLEKSPQEVASLIRGKADTKVKIVLLSQDASASRTLEIVRDRIDIDNIQWKKLDNGVAHIIIYKFTEETLEKIASQWDQVVSEIKQQNMKYIVLDLRGNPGGYVNTASYIAEDFLPQGKIILQEEYKSGKKLQTVVQRSGRLLDIPVVVLVNAGSASASEILSAALQEHGRAQIIGEKTVGKGVEQRTINFNDGSMLVVVFRKWLTPNGKQISKESPINPDILISNKQGDKKDYQLEKAIELLKGSK